MITAAIALASSQAFAQEPSWTAEAAVSNALSSPGIERMLDGELRAAVATVEAATVVPVPRLGVSRAEVFGDTNVGTVEYAVTVEQELDVSGWRGRLRGSLPHREAAIRAAHDVRRQEIAEAVQTAFYGVRYRQERVLAMDLWIARIAQGLESVRARQGRGDVSLYDVDRVRRELEIVGGQRAVERSRLAEAWATLETWTTAPRRPTLVGELAPTTPGRRGDAPLPDLVRLQALDGALAAEIDALGAPVLRGWTLGAGYRHVTVGPSVGQGFELTLTVPLALWSTDEASVDRLRAEQTEIGGELELSRARSEQAERAAARRLEEALDALSGLPDAGRDAELTQLAEASFAAGESTLTELLDAYRSEVELQLSRIDLQWEARRASIELNRRRGTGVAP